MILLKQAIPSILFRALWAAQNIIVLLFIGKEVGGPDLIAGFGIQTMLTNAAFNTIAFGFNSVLETFIA